ncbi:MAG: aspartate--tRNA(Asn) ligase [Candidatus Rehaiarchaeum fermentans]|nr:aspartate--tRNA(Asn) ligase [Candidatus Rehaiarchaeum fermentans]MCW1297539.1 aspartate--tRNA(Asn) ligase [Candidatus Rehaiarchaeum fermentans]
MIVQRGEKTIINGFVKQVRDLGKICFLIIRDINGEYQVTIKDEKLLSQAKELKDESVVRVEGKRVENPSVINGWELIPEKIEIYTIAEQPLPLNLSIKSGLDKEIDYRFLSLRIPRIASIFKIESTVNNAIQEFFNKNGFFTIHTSKIVAAATEGGANVFPILYFDKQAFLAQSPQFYKQMMMSAGFEKVIEIGPVFRAEPHHDTRHLCEYTSIDIEVSYIKSYEDIMKYLEKALQYTIKKVIKINQKELEILGIKLEIPKLPFPRITMKEAKEILKSKYNKEEEEDLDPEGERLMGSYVKETYNSDFFFLTEFPWSVAQFYHMRKKEDNNVTYRADLIYKGLEISTLAQREHRYEILLNQLKEKGLHPEEFKFYLDFFRYGVPPHGGAGLGLERIVKQMLNLENVQESTLLPRTPTHLVP